MPKWVSLKDLMENPSKYGVEDPRLLEIAYTPDKQSITLTPDETGYNAKQNFETEIGKHRYYPIIYKENLYLVSNRVAEDSLSLGGKVGYKNGPKALKKHSQLWSNEKLTAKGETWNEETIGINDILPRRGIPEVELLVSAEYFYCYWTAIQWFDSDGVGLKTVTFSNDVRVIEDYLFYSNEGEADISCTDDYDIRPLISLPSDIEVDIETLDGTPLSIRLPLSDSKADIEKADDTEPSTNSPFPSTETGSKNMISNLKLLEEQEKETDESATALIAKLKEIAIQVQ